MHLRKQEQISNIVWVYLVIFYNPGDSIQRSDCVGLYRIISEKLPDFIGSDGNPSKVAGILTTGFRQQFWDVGKCRIFRVPTGSWPFRHFPTSDDFLSESDTRIPTTSDEFPSDPIKSDNFPIGSDGIRLSDCSTWVTLIPFV